MESDFSSYPFDWTNVPRQMRTKRKSKLNGKEAPSRPKEALFTPKEELSKPKEALSTPKEELSKLKEVLSKPKEALSRPKEAPSRPTEVLSRPKEEHSTPKETLSTPKEGLSKPKEELSTPKEELSTPKEEVSKPKQALSTTKEELSKPKEALSTPKEALSTPKEVLSKPKEALSRPKAKLDSGGFDIYLKKIWKICSEDRKRHFTCFDSLWFSLYRTASSKDKVLTWIKKEPIFSKAYVFVPIVCWGHWSLLILCHFGESLQSTTRSRCMLLLDSLEMANPRRLEPEIRRFVLDIYKTGDRPETKHLVYRIPFLVPKVPQQRDGNECGFFILYFINLFLELAPDNFSMEGYPYFMKKDWFTIEDLDRFYERLVSLN